MDIKDILFPGEAGTRELVEEYGDKVVCIRHRHDEVHNRRVRTVEIIVDESDWPDELSRECDNGVFVRIETGENDLQRLIEAVGGRWSPENNAWKMNYRKALQIGLEGRIVH